MEKQADCQETCNLEATLSKLIWKNVRNNYLVRVRREKGSRMEKQEQPTVAPILIVYVMTGGAL